MADEDEVTLFGKLKSKLIDTKQKWAEDGRLLTGHTAAPTERLPPAAYAPETSARVYDEMLALARRILAAGHAVVLDAVFLRPDERQAAASVATGAGVPFRGAWLRGETPMLAQRLAARAGDASDAGPATLDEQLSHDPGQIDWTILDAADLGAAAARLAPQAAEN